MGRPSNMMLDILARIEAGEPLKKVDPRRTCPFTVGWRNPQSCDDCNGAICARYRAKGLNEQGQPLPRRLLPLCGAKTQAGGSCRMKVIPGKQRCKFHGGMSTGPKTPEGRARISEAQKRRWHVANSRQGNAANVR